MRLDEAAVRLERRTFQLYQYLLLNPERVITKDELLREVWGARVLSDGAVSNAIAKLRRTLGQRPGSRTPIETVHGLGYRYYGGAASEEADASDALPSAVTAEYPFVGRHRELRVLRRRLEETLQGRGGAVLVAGRSGVGKTRLVQAFTEMARAAGAEVFVGVPDRLGELPWPSLATLVETSGSAPTTPADVEVGSRVAQTDSRGDRARVIVLDDAQDLNPSGSEALRLWRRGLEHHAAICVITVRTMDVATAGCEAALSALRPTTEEVHLVGLEPIDVAAFLAHSGVADRSLAGALHGQTAGNPRLLWQLLLSAEPLARALEPEHAPTGDWLPAVRETLLRPLEALPPAARRLLNAAAVLGAEFDVGTLARVAAEDAHVAMTTLERAVELAFLSPSRVPSRFSFAPPLLRGALYHALSPAERGGLHDRAASAMQSCSPAEPAALLALAEHRLRALPVDPDAVTSTALRVGTELAAGGGYELAGALLRRALTTLEGTGAQAPSRFALYLELAWAEFHAGHTDPAFHCCEQAFAVYDGSQAGDELLSLAQLLSECVFAGAHSMCRARELIINAIGPTDVQARGGAATRRRLEAYAHALRAPVPDVQAPAQETSGAAEGPGDAAILHARSLASVRLSHDRRVFAAPPPDALAVTSMSDARQARRTAIYRFAAHRAAYIRALTRCDVTAADQALAMCLEAADEAHAKPAQAVAKMMAVGRVTGEGRIDEAHHMLHELRSMVGELHAEKLSLAAFGLGIQLAERQGRIHDLCVKAEDTFRAVINTGSAYSRMLRIALGRLYALDGQGERSAALLSGLTHQGWFTRAPTVYGDLGLLCWMSQTYCLLGDTGGAQKVYGHLAPYANCCGMLPGFGYVGAVSHALGNVDRTLGRGLEARKNFALAIEQHKRLGMPDQLQASCKALKAASPEVRPD